MANKIRTLTSANSVFTISIPGLYDAPVQIEGYASDASWAVDGIAASEARMGVDGKLSAGMTFNPIKQKISLEADSLSVDIFETWFNAQQSARDVFFANATIDVPGLGKSFTLTKGALTMHKPFPDAKKTLQAVEFEVTWESVSTAQV